MSHTYSNLLVHIVFSTQGRLPLISKEMRAELFSYIGALVKEQNGKPIIINGIADHVHMLVEFPPNVNISEAMRFIKANSSRLAKQRFGKPFAWQKGFGAFSVSRSNSDAVAKYIRDQDIHHQKFDVKVEFISLLKKSGVDFEEEYLWK